MSDLVPMQIGTWIGMTFYATEADRQRARASQKPARARSPRAALSPAPLPTTAPAPPLPPKEQE